MAATAAAPNAVSWSTMTDLLEQTGAGAMERRWRSGAGGGLIQDELDTRTSTRDPDLYRRTDLSTGCFLGFGHPRARCELRCSQCRRSMPTVATSPRRG